MNISVDTLHKGEIEDNNNNNNNNNNNDTASALCKISTHVWQNRPVFGGIDLCLVK
jgi:hypothetical protein